MSSPSAAMLGNTSRYSTSIRYMSGGSDFTNFLSSYLPTVDTRGIVMSLSSFLSTYRHPVLPDSRLMRIMSPMLDFGGLVCSQYERHIPTPESTPAVSRGSSSSSLRSLFTSTLLTRSSIECSGIFPLSVIHPPSILEYLLICSPTSLTTCSSSAGSDDLISHTIPFRSLSHWNITSGHTGVEDDVVIFGSLTLNVHGSSSVNMSLRPTDTNTVL